MRIGPSLGAGTLRPATKNVKKKVDGRRARKNPPVIMVELPLDFAARARDVGLTPEKVLALLAQDFCVRAPKRIAVENPPRKPARRRTPKGVISFPVPYRPRPGKDPREECEILRKIMENSSAFQAITRAINEAMRSRAKDGPKKSKPGNLD